MKQLDKELVDYIINNYYYDDNVLMNIKTGKVVKPNEYKGVVKGWAMRGNYIQVETMIDIFKDKPKPETKSINELLIKDYHYNINNRTLFNKKTRQYLKPRSYQDGLPKSYFVFNKLITTRLLSELYKDLQDITLDDKRFCLCCKKDIETKHFTTKLNCDFCLMDYLIKKRPEVLVKHKEYFEARNFLLKLKAKGWRANPQDIFSLINFYDYYYPNTCVDRFDEDSAIHILHKIINKNYEERSEIINKSFA